VAVWHKYISRQSAYILRRNVLRECVESGAIMTMLNVSLGAAEDVFGFSDLERAFLVL